jgi:ABC-type transport system involved in multi-copper enzyme maturation permease subunit
MRRSLSLDARHVASYLLRAFWVLAIGATFVGYSIAYSTARGTAGGLQFFSSVTMINLVFISLAAVGLFANMMTEEKEEHMLDLLLMTGVGPTSLMASKFTACLTTGVFLLLAQLPFTVIATGLGGLTLQQVAAAYVLLLAYLFLACAIAMLASVVLPGTPTAMAATGVALLLFLFGPILAQWIIEVPLRYFTGLTLTFSADRWMDLTSPFRRGEDIMATKFAGELFASSIYSCALIALLCLLLARLVFDLSVRRMQKSASAGPMPLSTCWRGRVWRRALAWKSYNLCVGGHVGILCRVFLYGVTAGVCYISTTQTSDFGMGIAIAGAVGLLLEAVYIAGRLGNREVVDCTLPTLVGLPNSSETLIRTSIQGVLPTFIPAAVLFAAGICTVATFDGVGGLADILRVAIVGGPAAATFILLVARLSLHMRYGATLSTIFIFFVTFAIGTVIFGIFVISLGFLVPLVAFVWLCSTTPEAVRDAAGRV